jgi:hypothetical protein
VIAEREKRYYFNSLAWAAKAEYLILKSSKKAVNFSWVQNEINRPKS